MTWRLKLVAFTVAGLASTSTFAGAAVSTTRSGLRGKVMEGPTRPVCHVGEPCEKPAAEVVLEFRRSGVLVARARTTQTGTYSVRLRRGYYRVRATHTPLAKTLTPCTVKVPRDRFARVDFHLDTGIE
jgi:hypothetical protein